MTDFASLADRIVKKMEAGLPVTLALDSDVETIIEALHLAAETHNALVEPASSLTENGASKPEPAAWQWRSFFNGRWGAWIELNQPIETFKARNSLMFDEGIYEARPLYAHPPEVTEGEPPSPNPVAHAFRCADEKDWQHLFLYIPHSGHGKFWRAVFSEVRAALSSTERR